MDIDYFLRTKYEENQVEGVLRTEELYKNISNTYLKHLFAVMHQSINGLLSFMQSKKNSNGHYNATESRELLRMIKLYEDIKYDKGITIIAVITNAIIYVLADSVDVVFSFFDLV